MKVPQPSDFAVLLLAHGGPESLDDIPDFLRHIRGGKPLSPAFIEEVVARYALIGGKSPLRETCENLADKLNRAINRPVYVGMRHWNPFTAKSVQKIKEDGHNQVLVICLAPHFSEMSIGAYKKSFIAANQLSMPELAFHFIENWHVDAKFIEFHAREIVKVKDELSAREWDDTQVLFTAHSLPARILASGDPYVTQLNQTMNAICERIALPSEKYELVFQSASPTPEPWLSPTLEQRLERLAESKTRRVLVVPIGFVAEHVEVLYDLDIAAKEQAKASGIVLQRTNMLNDRQEMVAIMQGIVEESASRFSQTVIIEATERCFA